MRCLIAKRTRSETHSTIQLWNGTALEFLPQHSQRFDCIVADIPYGTGKKQQIHGNVYSDPTQREMERMLIALIPLLRDALTDQGTLYLMCDNRLKWFAHWQLGFFFGRDRFVNEIIWSYDYGGRSKKKWPEKHDTILMFTKTKHYIWNPDRVNRLPYKAPSLCGPEKAKRGKFPTDVWENSIVGTNSGERLNYPTQKPEAIFRNFRVSTNDTSHVLDPFAGSGTTGAVFDGWVDQIHLCDTNPQAIEIMQRRLRHATVQEVQHGI